MSEKTNINTSWHDELILGTIYKNNLKDCTPRKEQKSMNILNGKSYEDIQEEIKQNNQEQDKQSIQALENMIQKEKDKNKDFIDQFSKYMEQEKQTNINDAKIELENKHQEELEKLNNEKELDKAWQSVVSGIRNHNSFFGYIQPGTTEKTTNNKQLTSKEKEMQDFLKALPHR